MAAAATTAATTAAATAGGTPSSCPVRPRDAEVMPTLFISHGGGPSFFLDGHPLGPDSSLARAFRGMAATLPRPRAVLVISAHWETDRTVTVSNNPKPGMLFDYYGFPAHTYQLSFPAPGEPALAARVASLLSAAGLPCAQDSVRGFDHGVFVPLMLVYPKADLPVVAMSLRSDLDASFHLAVGEALRPLRSEGVLIIGSGFSAHNFFADSSTAHKARAAATFDAWLRDTATRVPPSKRAHRLASWERAPAGREAHPREEHLLPLMVAAGAAGEDAGECIFKDDVLLAPGQPAFATSMYRFG